MTRDEYAEFKRTGIRPGARRWRSLIVLLVGLGLALVGALHLSNIDADRTLERMKAVDERAVAGSPRR